MFVFVKARTGERERQRQTDRPSLTQMSLQEPDVGLKDVENVSRNRWTENKDRERKRRERKRGRRKEGIRT